MFSRNASRVRLGLGGDLQRPEAKRLGLGSVIFEVHEVRALK
jgi:hypothetical protein